MGRLRNLIREIHRRSLWQVLAVYLAGSWVALQVVDHLTRTAGLPDWVPPFAVVLLVLGLPIVMATAVVQEGGPGRQAEPELPPEELRVPSPSATPRRSLIRHLTWSRAILGGVLAFSLLGAAVAGYFVMRVAGIGPVASLVAKGMIEEGEVVVLADFRNATNDPLLGSVVTQALRSDLAGSRALTVLDPTRVQEVLVRMGRDPADGLTPELAREVALREGVKAVLEGEIGAAGSGYILTAALRTAEDGSTLAPFRRNARNDDALVEAIDRLSQDIREKAGESLREIRGGGTLRQVTTGSLDALRRYTEADLLSAEGREREALAVLQEAVALDPEFAMAWRKIAVVLGNLGEDPERVREAAQEAYRLRDRLTERERYLAEAYYHSTVSEDREATIRAYERVLALAPEDPVALNNLGLQYVQLGRLNEAEELFTRAVALPEPSASAHLNLVHAHARQGAFEEAREALERYRTGFPEDPRIQLPAFLVYSMSLELDRAGEALDSLLARSDVPPPVRNQTRRNRTLLDAVAGRSDRARERFTEHARELGPQEGHAELAVMAWMEAWILEDPDRARAALQAAVDMARDGGGHPGQLTRFVGSTVFVLARDWTAARAWTDEWATEIVSAEAEQAAGPEMTTDLELFHLWAHVGEEDPDAVVEALRRRSADPECFRCVDELVAVALERAGRPEEALALWQEIRARGVQNPQLSVALIPVALREVARLAATLGDHATAREAYRTLAELWADADPPLQERLAGLGAEIEGS